MSRRRVRIPVHQAVRFELLNYERLILRKRAQVPVGDHEVAEVDMSIEMSLREWKKLRKAIRKARNRRKEKAAQMMATIRRPPPVAGPLGQRRG